MNPSERMTQILAVVHNSVPDRHLERLLASGGFGVLLCKNASAARNQLVRTIPDLILISEQIENGSGFDLANELLSRFPAAPLILIFDEARSDNAERALNLGATGYVSLPVRSEEFLDLIKLNLSKAKRRKDWLLRESRRKTSTLIRQLSDLEILFENTHDLILMLNQDDRVLFANRSLRDLFMIEDQIFTGRDYHEVFTHPKLLELIRSSESETAQWLELEIDQELIFSVQTKSVPDFGRIFTMHDITQLKRIDRIKNEFVSAVSHDLRSPLTAIMGYVELIDRVGEVNEMQQNFIQKVIVSVHNISQLIDDLLNLSKIEASFQPGGEPVEINKLIHYATQTFSSQIMEKNLNIELDLQPKAASVYGDTIQLRQLFENLLENSIKYTPEDGKIHVSSINQDDQVIIQISDNGIGIPKNEQPHIFEKFYRASNIDEGIIGTGLGLAIVKSIIDNHKGRIWVDSDADEGATFTIVLPLRQENLNYLQTSFKQRADVS